MMHSKFTLEYARFRDRSVTVSVTVHLKSFGPSTFILKDLPVLIIKTVQSFCPLNHILFYFGTRHVHGLSALSL